LIAYLGTSQDAPLLDEARRSLVKIGRPALDALLRTLAGGNRSARREAATTLGMLHDDSATHALTKALSDDDDSVVHAVARALGELGDVSAQSALLDLVLSPAEVQQYVRLAARRALESLGCLPEDAAGRIRIDLATDRLDMIGTWGAAKAVPLLVAVLDGRDGREIPGSRARAAKALGELRNEDALEALCAAVRDRHDAVRNEAVQALARFRDPAATAGILEAVREWWSDEWQPSRLVWSTAWKALTTLGPEAVEQLIAGGQEVPLLVGKKALEWLRSAGGRPGGDARSAWKAVLDVDEDAIARLGERALAPLTAALKTRDEFYSGYGSTFGRCLAATGDRRAAAPLLDAVGAAHLSAFSRGVCLASLAALLPKVSSDLTTEELRRMSRLPRKILEDVVSFSGDDFLSFRGEISQVLGRITEPVDLPDHFSAIVRGEIERRSNLGDPGATPGGGRRRKKGETPL
jgi:HEAT repeat protein